MRKRILLRATLLSAILLTFDGFATAAEQADPCAACADAPRQADAEDGASPAAASSRIFGIIPNYRTSPSLDDYQPLGAEDKYRLARQDAFDRGTLVLAAVFAGDGEVTNSDPAFGRGAKGFGRYFGAAYADFVIGDVMTEAVFPSLLHQDPRYFRRGTGGVWSRIGYALGQTFWTHTDAGKGAFNYSGVLGTATGVAISRAYYPKDRGGPSAVSRVSTQIGVDMAANVLKEFWPDLSRKFARLRQAHRDEGAE